MPPLSPLWWGYSPYIGYYRELKTNKQTTAFQHLSKLIQTGLVCTLPGVTQQSNAFWSKKGKKIHPLGDRVVILWTNDNQEYRK